MSSVSKHWASMGSILMSVVCLSDAAAYPEFEKYVESISVRTIDCALCHMHPDGPQGIKAGQIGSLSPEQLDELGRARAAFDPGIGIDNPILNDFGDSIINQLGKTRLLQLRLEPAQLPAELGASQDLDGDGIPDVEELRAGTHPLDPEHGSPARLFLINIKRRWFHVVMIILATGIGLYGLSHLLQAFAASAGKARKEETESYGPSEERYHAG